VLDNLNTHKRKNDRWLKRHPNVRFHFTPPRASWLNQVEIWFSILQGKSLQGVSFTSVRQLKEHIDPFIEDYNKNARPFVWIKAKVFQRRVKGSTYQPTVIPGTRSRFLDYFNHLASLTAASHKGSHSSSRWRKSHFTLLLCRKMCLARGSPAASKS
jgi:hypothetical protein